MTDNILTIAEAAQHFDVSERTIRRWIESGKLTSERTNGQRFVRLDTRTTECPNDRQTDNPVSNQLESENAHLREQLDRADSEIQHLREQLSRRDEQIESLLQQQEHFQQLLAMQSKTTAALTEQLDTSRQMIEDMRQRKSSWFKRTFRWT